MSDLIATTEDIRHAYRLLLGREPDEGGFRTYCELVKRNQLRPELVARYLMDSAEFRERHGVLTAMDAGHAPDADSPKLVCQACTQRQVESPTFRHWAVALREKPGRLHRKLWEWCFIAQALQERGLLQEGRQGLGFAVGTEPLSALFAQLGCTIVASDIGMQLADAGWVASNQHATGLAQLNLRGLCPPEMFAARVSFREIDMRAIPSDLSQFDFLWSSCALEHLGSLRNGMDYVVNSMRCLRDGGVAVHTTEFNCDSDEDTIETGNAVIYRRKDLRELADRLVAMGHKVEPFDFYLGDSPADGYVDEPPYKGSSCLKLRLGPYAATSFGLIITKGHAD